MRQAHQALSGIHLHSELSCCIGNTLSLVGSDIAKDNVLYCYNYGIQVHFSVLIGFFLSPSDESFPLAYIDHRFEDPSGRPEL